MLNTVVFQKEDVREIITGLGLEINAKNQIVSDGKIAHCRACKEEITINNTGNISKGSKVFYCDKPGCFALRSIERLEKQKMDK